MVFNMQTDDTPPLPEAILEYERRRCAICGARYPSFGFGPPLTRSGVFLWACATHRLDLEERLKNGGSQARPGQADRSGSRAGDRNEDEVGAPAASARGAARVTRKRAPGFAG